MTATPNKIRTARSGFFLRLAQSKRIDEGRDRQTIPLFPLLLIMKADGTLTREVAYLAEKIQA